MNSFSSCCIRDVLREHNQLPNGIDTLRLPKRLQRYIDLTEELEGPEAQEDKEDREERDPQKGKSPPKCKLGSEVPRLETISSAEESEDESENHVQLLQAVTDPEKAALAAFVATGDGAYTEEAKKAAVAAYVAACPPDFDPDFPPISLPGEPR